MKILLASLMCLVLGASPCFALKGGPPYPPGPRSVTGTFAGVLLPQVGQTSNSLGLFSLPLPTTGLGTGVLVIFNAGQLYTGSMQGVGDPQTAAVTGLIRATFPYLTTVQTGVDTNGNPIFTTVTVVAVAAGIMSARIVTRRSTFNNSTSDRITGTSDVQFSLVVNQPFDEVLYDIIGFKQSGS